MNSVPENQSPRPPSEIAEDLARVTEELTLLSEAPSSSTDLIPVTEVGPDEMKKDLAKRHSTLQRAAARARALQKELEQSLQDQIRAANAALAPLQIEIDRLREGIWAVSLYTGRDEEVVLIQDGTPAPANTPLTIRQMVLAMDEETAAFAGKGGIDFRNFDLIDEWLTDPQNLAQVAPWPKCIVVFRARRSEKDYGDPFINEALNEDNMRSHWLLKNGDRLYRMTTDLDVGNRLIPRRDEFVSLFRETQRNRETGEEETVDLIPGSSSWARAEKAQDRLHRHYMRCALVIQGLLDRTPLFQPFVDDAPFSVLHPEAYERGLVEIVSDDETNLLGVGRKPFYEWLRDLNATLRPGMRVIGDFSTDAFSYTNEFETDRWRRHTRLTPRNAEIPPSNVIHRLNAWKTDRGEKGLVFSYARTREDFIREKNGDYAVRAPKNRATCIIYPHDRFILPFDLVTISEMEGYLSSRTERHAYDDMMPLLRVAIEAKKVELAEEAPFRQLLIGAVAKEYNLDIDDALAAFVDSAVSEWKLANRWHRPLVSSATSPDGADKDTEAKAVRYVISSYAQQRAAGDEDQALRRLLEHDPEIIYVGRARTGKYVAFAPTTRGFAKEAAPANAFVTEYNIAGTTGTGAISKKTWQLPGSRSAKLRTIYAAPLWAKWDLNATKTTHLTDHDLNALALQAIEAANAVVTKSQFKDTELMAVTYDHDNATFEAWYTPVSSSGTSSRNLGTYHVADVPLVRIRWKRRSSTNFELSPQTRTQTTSWNSTEALPWRPVWDGVSRHRAPIVVITPALANSTATRLSVEAQNNASSVLYSAVRAALSQIENQWVTNAQAAAHSRFAEDFADEDLWQDHLKSLKLQYPYRSFKKGRICSDDIEKAFFTLVTKGHLLLGTLTELVTASKLRDITDKEIPADIKDIFIDSPVPSPKPPSVTEPSPDGQDSEDADDDFTEEFSLTDAEDDFEAADTAAAEESDEPEEDTQSDEPDEYVLILPGEDYLR